MVPIWVQGYWPVDEVHLRWQKALLHKRQNEQGTGRTVEIIRPEISEGLIEALLHSRMVRAPQFTGDLRCNVGKLGRLGRRDSICYIRRLLLWERQMLSNLGRLPSRFRTPCTVKIHQLSSRSQGPYVTHQAQSRCRYPALSAVSTASATSLGLDCQVPTSS